MGQEVSLYHCGNRDAKSLGQDWEKCYDQAGRGDSCCMFSSGEVPCEGLWAVLGSPVPVPQGQQ